MIPPWYPSGRSGRFSGGRSTGSAAAVSMAPRGMINHRGGNRTSFMVGSGEARQGTWAWPRLGKFGVSRHLAQRATWGTDDSRRPPLHQGALGGCSVVTEASELKEFARRARLAIVSGLFADAEPGGPVLPAWVRPTACSMRQPVRYAAGTRNEW